MRWLQILDATAGSRCRISLYLPAEWSYNGKIEPVLSRILSDQDMAKLKEE